MERVNSIMHSPKIQRSIRINDSQIIMLAEKARFDNAMSGFLYKKSSGAGKWTRRYFILFQNLMFYFEAENGVRPSGVIMLEGCYCERLILKDKLYSFGITYRRENLRHYELRAESESECKAWIDAVRVASFNKLLLQKEELEQKYLHLVQIVESEKTAKWQYTVQCEQLASEIKKLRSEVSSSVLRQKLYEKEWRFGGGAQTSLTTGLDSEDLKKIKKVQSFFRGWLCRRRWKQIVEEYIRSPHAEAMRKRNSLVFRMVEAEEEYVEQLEIVVSGFLRPMRMAASSKTPPVTHEDVSSIYLNVETVLFLHQIFLKGLTARIDSWPTLVLGDLFDMLLPMLSIYQEYVRNHHYSLQVLTECKQQAQFGLMLSRLENKPACQGRSLEVYLTYPMHQIPRYIITLHELLAHTPYDHVERKSLENARAQLEELSRQMHDEVSETENLRKNLAIERMIVEGCDILLDVNQVFVRQGSLIHLIESGNKKARTPRILKPEKEAVRQSFLFSNHLILTTRAANGRLHLVPHVGKIPLADATLIEDPSDVNETEINDDVSISSQSSYSDSSNSQLIKKCVVLADTPHMGLDFKILLDTKNGQVTIHMVAPSAQEKHAWTSDISQCMDNVHFNDLLHGSDSASVAVPHSVRSDPKLFKDDVDIRFSRTLNSCKVPQIRYATPQRLLERLTDLRFLSIDFLNTFLLTYRVFTDSVTVLEALKKVYYCAEPLEGGDNLEGIVKEDDPRMDEGYRRISTTSTVSGYGTESDRDPAIMYDSSKGPHWRWSYRKMEEHSGATYLSPAGHTSPPARKKSVTLRVEDIGGHLLVPPGASTSCSSETLTDQTAKKRHHSITSIASETSESETEEETKKPENLSAANCKTNSPAQTRKASSTSIYAAILQRRASKQRPSFVESEMGAGSTPRSSFQTHGSESPQMSSKAGVVVTSSRQSQRRSSSASAAAAFAIATAGTTTTRVPGQTEVVVPENEELKFVRPRKESVLSSAATMRVLSVLRHWVAKHSQDFDDPRLRDLTVSFLEDILCSPALLPAENKAASQLLRMLTREETKKTDLTSLLAAVQVWTNKLISTALSLAISLFQSKETIETLSALEIAEQMTYLDHEIFISIRSEEFLGQSWTKDDKEHRAPHILLMTRRFNEVSRLVVSEVIRQPNQTGRLQAMEKWVAVGDICRVLHNFNGVLQICAAFTNSAVYRLKKTYEKLSKTTKGTLDRLHSLVGSDGRFRGLREALHRVDPPGIPYLGMYLSDLTFIEESTPNFTADGLLNFAKMRMIAHVIREIRQFQQTPYKIEYGAKASSYLRDPKLLLDDDQLYKLSLQIEPKQARLTSQSSQS
ncbi:ras-specific guanine nucleotide-releasing factor 2-like isoform X3 [Folsomia candida]|uniref:ras-specific guanine nucleotide-releasing factor 2-like isoform X3 n=1 Tax=Folsomia candida TaxID=158441 RepID=UPI00160546F1|nr:ras-specific guanine nucleotide-releasing factor 2-like isoform X3 [Folsomia candida]